MRTRAILLIAALLAGTWPAAAAERRAAAPRSVAAQALFRHDWLLMNWALRFYDGDRDVVLSPAEAAVAAKAFRKIADKDRDGRVTPAEYSAARKFIIARY